MDSNDLRLELKSIDTSSLVDKAEMRFIESKKHKGTIIKSPDLSVIFRKSIIPRILLLKTGTAEEVREGMRMHLENHFHRILNENTVNVSVA